MKLKLTFLRRDVLCCFGFSKFNKEVAMLSWVNNIIGDNKRANYSNANLQTVSPGLTTAWFGCRLGRQTSKLRGDTGSACSSKANAPNIFHIVLRFRSLDSFLWKLLRNLRYWNNYVNSTYLCHELAFRQWLLNKQISTPHKNPHL